MWSDDQCYALDGKVRTHSTSCGSRDASLLTGQGATEDLGNGSCGVTSSRSVTIDGRESEGEEGSETKQGGFAVHDCKVKGEGSK
jgi:hypothetical protein